MLRGHNPRRSADDLRSARRLVARAEREALDRAEQLRAEAEAILESATECVAGIEAKVREDYAERMEALQAELDAVSRRATQAERELYALRAADTGTSAPAEVDRRWSTKELAAVLAAAAQQAEERLETALASIERDTALAAEARREAEAALQRARAEAVREVLDGAEAARPVLDGVEAGRPAPPAVDAGVIRYGRRRTDREGPVEGGPPSTAPYSSDNNHIHDS